jgi:hypothetical protein
MLKLYNSNNVFKEIYHRTYPCLYQLELQLHIHFSQFQSAFSEKCNYTNQEFQNKCHMGGRYQTAPEINIACAGVLKLLQKLNRNKAVGPDNIRPKILKELAPEIAPILTIIFRKSLETGEVPPDWRLANVNPV